MASISAADGKYRVFLRKANAPSYSLRFETKEEAKKWLLDNEPLYRSNPHNFVKIKNIEKETQMYQTNPQEHPEYQKIFLEMKAVIEEYFSSNEVSSEEIAKATQEIYNISLKYKKEK